MRKTNENNKQSSKSKDCGGKSCGSKNSKNCK